MKGSEELSLGYYFVSSWFGIKKSLIISLGKCRTRPKTASHIFYFSEQNVKKVFIVLHPSQNVTGSIGEKGHCEKLALFTQYNGYKSFSRVAL